MLSSSTEKGTFSEPAVYFRELFLFALQNNHPIAFWQLPQQNIQHCILDFGKEVRTLRPDLEEMGEGFIAGRFLNPELNETCFIKADLYINSVQLNQSGRELDPRLLDILQQKPAAEGQMGAWLKPDATPYNPEESEKTLYRQFTALVSKGKEKILQKEFQKVVLSRRLAFAYPKNFDALALFQKLCATYPTAFCYLFHLPGWGTWMGASPELLIGSEKNRFFRTVALAATQVYLGQPLHLVSWTQKEIEEQALVSRYIINCFKKIRLREFEEEGPKTILAGKLAHLRTTFLVDMQATAFPQLGTVMLHLLHPTSAVCGMPKEEALAFILKNEGYDREFYSGFMGPVNIGNESHIFVNLRCMQLAREKIILYAGAGITVDSDPQKEWDETAFKMDTLRSLIG